ncbi:hypothetical protein HK104_009900, partial [Borealophlyctis nickersoniae]
MATLPQSGRAWIKAVLSGDTVVLRGKPQSGPPAEKTFSFSNISAPRLGNAKEPEKEEPFAFESREFLRRVLIGKEVAYKFEYTTTTNARDFGVLMVQHPINGETNITRVIVKDGWAKVKTPDGKRTVRDASEEQTNLAELEAQAQAAKKGIWADKDATGKVGVRTAAYALKEEPRAFLEKHKGKPIDAILEQVRDGSTYRVCLIIPAGNGKTHQYITLMLSGIKAPTYRKDVPNVPDIVEEFSEEAKYFVESRLLQRDIKVVLEGLSSNDNFIGSVQFPMGNIAEALLGEGLAKVVDWNITLVTGGPQKYRAAEARAKERKLRLWKNWVGKPRVGGPEPEFDGIVTRVLSGDMLIIQSVTSGKEHRVTLSSIRAPKGAVASKPADGKGGEKDSVKEYGYDLDAKEFLRSRLIGKQVHVIVDYIQAANAGFEERECATVKQGDKNVAELLLNRGLAHVIRHRRDDENRSSAYDQLLAAYDKAEKAQKGVHSTKEAPVYRITDASFNAARARQFFPYLQRSGVVNGVVDYVASGSRFRIHVPSQNCALTLVLGGIRAPRAGRPGEKSEPFGQEALDFVNQRVMQRDVEFSVEGTDKVGGFIGALFTKTENDRQNVAVMLLKEGLASVHDYSASQSPHANSLYEAERQAKEARKGMWKEWTGEQEEVQQEEKIDEEKPAETKEVLVSHIDGGGRVFLQIVSDDLRRLDSVMTKFAAFHAEANSEPVAPFSPRTGEYCSAKFTVDDTWYRARIRKANPDKTYNVTYIDFGNSETIPASRLRPLDSQFNTNALPPQAVEAKLAYISVPELDADYGEEAFEYLRDATEGKTLQARILGRVQTATGTALNVLLFDPKKGEISLNEKLVKDGYGFVEKAYAKKYAAEQKAAKAAGAWGAAAAAAKSKKNVLASLMEAQEDAKKSR